MIFMGHPKNTIFAAVIQNFQRAQSLAKTVFNGLPLIP
jgi:hypothetical protein